MIYRAGKAAAAIHRFMCENTLFGYDQAHRWFNAGYTVPFETQGVRFNIPVGDGDCSSSVKKAWEIALQPTPYAGALGVDGYNSNGQFYTWYTGNLEEGFRASGLFQSKSMAYLAEPGDLYLTHTANNDGTYSGHVAMCQTQRPDMLSEFVLNEFGGVVGGATGDQGNETVVRPYYDFPWRCILHYNGKADFEMGEDMTPEDIWNFELNGIKARDRLIGTDIAANAARAALRDRKDASGRGKDADMPTRLAYIAAKQEDSMKTLEQLLREVVSMGSELAQLKTEVAQLKNIER